MRARERTGGAATRETNIVNRERQQVVQFSASFAGERDCAKYLGNGVQPSSRYLVQYPGGEGQRACGISLPKGSEAAGARTSK